MTGVWLSSYKFYNFNIIRTQNVDVVVDGFLIIDYRYFLE
jgi:hypothetical protein